MMPDNEKSWKPSYFYIKYATLGQTIPIIKNGIAAFLMWTILMSVIGLLSDDKWNSGNYSPPKTEDLFGISNNFWYLCIVALITWFMKNKERKIIIPKFDNVEWVLLNLVFFIFFLSGSYLSWWAYSITFIGLVALAYIYEELVLVGKENYKKVNT